MLTEAPITPRPMREKAAEIFFETFGVPAFFVGLSSVLSMYFCKHPNFSMHLGTQVEEQQGLYWILETALLMQVFIYDFNY